MKIINCPQCNYILPENSKHELVLDSMFNGMYFFVCPECTRRFAKYPWEVYNDNSER